jgi:hypothetical protein
LRPSAPKDSIPLKPRANQAAGRTKDLKRISAKFTQPFSYTNRNGRMRPAQPLRGLPRPDHGIARPMEKIGTPGTNRPETYIGTVSGDFRRSFGVLWSFPV